MKKILIPLDVKNKNGRIYTKDSFKNLCNKTFLLEHFTQVVSPTVDLNDVVGQIQNVCIEENNVVGEIVLMDTYIVLQDLIQTDSVSIRPKSMALVDEKSGLVSNCQILSFNLVHKNSDSF